MGPLVTRPKPRPFRAQTWPTVSAPGIGRSGGLMSRGSIGRIGSVMRSPFEPSKRVHVGGAMVGGDEPSRDPPEAGPGDAGGGAAG